jgi:hypothetical protein
MTMAEQSTEENEKLVQEVYSRAMNRVHSGQSLEEPDRVVWEIEGLSQEVNSGASYEQYFRWRPVSEISAIVARLHGARLPEVAKLTQQAIEIAFPGGVPKTDEEKDDLTDWSEAQEAELQQLADQFTEYNGRIANVLAAGYRQMRGDQ